MKESPEFWRHLIEEAPPIQASEMPFFDDTESNVVSARRAGLDAEVYTDAPAFKAALARRGL